VSRVAILILALSIARIAAAGDDKAAITAELDREAAAWNRGDLDGFLSGYERAPTTTMIGKSALYRGWDAIAAMYRAHYGDRQRMGRLSFSELEIRPLSADYALAIGRWSLARDEKGGGAAGGFFTLTFHKSAIGWRITLDHTS
jgi:ketosteroid isomerase-like protein